MATALKATGQRRWQVKKEERKSELSDAEEFRHGGSTGKSEGAPWHGRWEKGEIQVEDAESWL